MLLFSSRKATDRPTRAPHASVHPSIHPSIPIAPFPLPCPKVTPEIKTATSASSLSGVGAAQLEQVRQRSVTKYGPPSSCHSLSRVSAWSRLLLLRGSSALACPACGPAVPDRPATTALAYCHGPGLASRSSCSSSALPCVGRRDRPGGRDTPVSFEHPGSCAQGEKLGSHRRAPRPRPPSLPSAQAWPRPSVGRPSSVCCLCLPSGSPPRLLQVFCSLPATWHLLCLLSSSHHITLSSRRLSLPSPCAALHSRPIPWRCLPNSPLSYRTPFPRVGSFEPRGTAPLPTCRGRD